MISLTHYLSTPFLSPVTPFPLPAPGLHMYQIRDPNIAPKSYLSILMWYLLWECVPWNEALQCLPGVPRGPQDDTCRLRAVEQALSLGLTEHINTHSCSVLLLQPQNIELTLENKNVGIKPGIHEVACFKVLRVYTAYHVTSQRN